MLDLRSRAIKFLQGRFPKAICCDQKLGILDKNAGETLKFLSVIVAMDPMTGVLQLMVCIPSLGSHDEHVLRGNNSNLISCAKSAAQELMNGVHVSMGNQNLPPEQYVANNQMTWAPKVIVYSDVLTVERSHTLSCLGACGEWIDLVVESEMHKSVFISYGGPDEIIADKINRSLRRHSVNTWFFADDAVPGQKLHRVMSQGVANHDRMLLICSRSSLNRNGVLNELERVLEREAKEGGIEILIPVAIDEFVFKDWSPMRSDLADQIRSRVIATIPEDEESTAFGVNMNKVLAALKLPS